MIKKLIFNLVPLFIIIFSFKDGYSQFYPGIPILGGSGFVEYTPGNLPVIISVPHDGHLEPSYIPDRNCNNCVYGNDLYTMELASSIYQAFYKQNGCYPYLIKNLLKRKKFDANRGIEDAADGNSRVEQAWYDYHNFIETAKAEIEENYGRGLFLDLHGHGHSVQRIELGYLITKNQLQLTDSDLDTQNYINRSSIKTLVGDNLLSFSHAELLRGKYSMGAMLERFNVLSVPSPQNPFPTGNEEYFNGGYNTREHGSIIGGNIDAIQIECHQSIRFDENLREMFAKDLTIVVNDFINTHYDNEYANNFCDVNINISESVISNSVEVFPNPTTNYINLDSNIQDVEIVIFNPAGKKVSSGFWYGKPVDLSFLKNGFYTIGIQKGETRLSFKKLIKF